MPFQFKITIFIAATAGLAWLSRSSLRALRFHGFYRFFAWESLLALILLNLDGWFYEPFSARQLVSWSLLVASVYLVLHGVHTLHRRGKPDTVRSDAALIGIEKTTALVTVGPYRYIRHPIYSSGLVGAWGVFLKQPSPAGTVLAAAATFFLTMTARIEEAENIRYFGDAYCRYMKRTRMFIPFLF